MRFPLFLIALPLTAALAACNAPQPDEQEVAQAQAQQAAADAAAPAPDLAEPPPVGNCDATQVQSLVGQELTDALSDQARQDSGATQVRVLKAGQMSTMEFIGDRLSIDLGEDGKISSVRCG